jgi:hypothetical protein
LDGPTGYLAPPSGGRRGAEMENCDWCGRSIEDHEETVTLTIRDETHVLCREDGESPETMADLIRHIKRADE